MNTLEVEKFLKNNKFTKKIFRGVIPIDYLPMRYVTRPSAYIINTGKSNTEGEHWFALYIPKNGPIEYFDSYGLKPINSEINQFITINKKKFIYNKFKIQPNNSFNCGKYSIFYLYLRSKKIPLRRIIKFFVKSKLYNDIFINKLFNKIKV